MRLQVILLSLLLFSGLCDARVKGQVDFSDAESSVGFFAKAHLSVTEAVLSDEGLLTGRVLVKVPAYGVKVPGRIEVPMSGIESTGEESSVSGRFFRDGGEAIDFECVVVRQSNGGGSVKIEISHGRHDLEFDTNFRVAGK